ncbi:poly(A)-binding protein binding protein [Malassezia nana]|uniref:Poly(A)-binding protein binding protein n=1 Tax=Malassezia nana TaxID=180528 RepID=A0AAF0J5K5_9BASI|nr:poly(A)-binding protein binding protein [Malassezia nana]
MALISMLVGQMVVVSVHGGTRYVGVLSSGTLSSGSEPGIVLCSAQVLEMTEKSVRAGEVLPTLTISLSDVLEVDASGARISSAQELQSQQAQQRRASGFRTDTEISGQTGARDGRTLQRWDDSSAAPTPMLQAQTSLEQSTRAGPWDQFAENEARFGVTSNYEETMYTTKLDKGGKDFQAREKEAERLAKEILEGSTTNAHVAEERNQVPAQEANEEDRYGAVVREPPASSAPPAQPAPPRTASSGKALTADFRQFVSAERERLVVRKAELAQKEKQSRLADLKVWAQTFQLKTLMPEDMALAMKKRADAAQSKSTSTVSSPATGPSAPVDQARQKLAAMTIPAIPPFKKAEEKKAPSKLNAKASAFNPTAAPFTQGARVSVPSVPFFGTRELKNRPNTTHLRVSDDFRAPKSKKLGEASKTSVWWSYTGRPFRQQVAMGVNNKPLYMGEGPVPMGAAPSLMPVAAASPYTPGLSPTLPPGTMLATNSPTPPPTSGPPGKSPRASHQQQAMMMPPAPTPSGTSSPHPVAQQPYAFVYPMGQYPFPAQQPYMPPPDAPGAPPMLYRAPPPPGFGASYAPVPAGAPGAMPPHGLYGVGHPPSPPKRSHTRGPKPHHRLSKAWAAESGASTEGPPKTGST